MLPNVITYAMALENLNKLQQGSWKFSEECHEVWSSSHNIFDLLEVTTLFGTAKTLTIEFVVNNYFKSFKKGTAYYNYVIFF